MITLYCSNFAQTTTPENLADLFSAKGFKPVEVNIVHRDRKGVQLINPYSFLHFDGDVSASAIILEMNGELYGVRRLLVRPAKPKVEPTA